MLPFATTWMDLGGIMISEICQKEKDKYCIYHLYVESKISNKLVNKTKKKQTHRHRKQTCYQRGEGKGREN